MSALIERLRRPSVSNEPPSRDDIRRNDVATFIWVVFILVLGVGIRNNALSAGNQITLGDDLLQVTLPAGWAQAAVATDDDSGLVASAGGEAGARGIAPAVSVWNSRSPSLFDATIDVRAQRLRPGENLALARARLGARRGQELFRYRELRAEPVTVLNLVPGTLVTYAYVADPTREAGALGPPVVVQGQDLLFINRDHLFRVSVAADSAGWDDEARAFDLVFDSLRIREATP